MSDVRGITINRVTAAVRANLFAQGSLSANEINSGSVDCRAVAIAALRALIEEDGQFSVPVELLVLGGCEPCSIQRVLDQTIGAALHYEAVQTSSPLPPRMRP